MKTIRIGRFPRTLRVCAVGTLFLVGCSRPSHTERAEPSASGAGVSFGTVMADVARRFELVGRAETAGRFELAEYELGEIDELFEGALPHATPPAEGHPEVLPARVTAFRVTTIPDLRRALATRDHAQVTTAFGRTATVCNGCHQASGHGFIEVPIAPGRGIPSTDPLVP